MARSLSLAMLLFCQGTAAGAGLPTADEEAAALVQGTGARGGLCLVLGAKRPDLGRALAAGSTVHSAGETFFGRRGYSR
jgi:hypothetical protein